MSLISGRSATCFLAQHVFLVDLQTRGLILHSSVGDKHVLVKSVLVWHSLGWLAEWDVLSVFDLWLMTVNHLQAWASNHPKTQIKHITKNKKSEVQYIHGPSYYVKNSMTPTQKVIRTALKRFCGGASLVHRTGSCSPFFCSLPLTSLTLLCRGAPREDMTIKELKDEAKQHGWQLQSSVRGVEKSNDGERLIAGYDYNFFECNLNFHSPRPWIVSPQSALDLAEGQAKHWHRSAFDHWWHYVASWILDRCRVYADNINKRQQRY